MLSETARYKTNYARLTAIALGVILLARLAALLTSPMELYADEAQYWRWGRSLDWGYYSKPPMIAWLIHVVTSLFGNAEWAVRLPAPVLHTFAASFLYLAGRDIYGPRTGFFAALLYALMPAVALSSTVLSTDGVLMPFWALGLWTFWRLRDGRGAWVSAAGLGLAIGAGFLSKYAMLYFLIGIVLTLLVDSPTRKALLSWKGLGALALGAAIFAPHMAWNAANEFKTISHTVDNANLGGQLFHPQHALTFLGDQLGVFGPLSLIALLAGLFFVRSENKALKERDRWLLCFTLPVLGIILFQAVLSRAHANWAVTAYPAASLLVATWLVRAHPNRNLWLWAAGLGFLAMQFLPTMPLLSKLFIGAGLGGIILATGALFKYRTSGLLWLNLGLHASLAIAFTIISLLPADMTATLGVDNALKRTRGWAAVSAATFNKAREIKATAILLDERENWHGLDYYGRSETLPLLSWRRYGPPKSYSEFAPLNDAIDSRVLVASKHANLRARMKDDFAHFERIGEIVIPLGVRSNGCEITRRLTLYLASNYQPQARTPDWEARYQGVTLDPNPPAVCTPQN